MIKKQFSIKKAKNMNESNLDQNQEFKPAGGGQKGKYLLPVSILIAGVLIAGASFYNTKVMIQSLGSGTVKQQAGLAQTAPVQGTQTAPTAVPEAAGQPVTVADRADEPVLGNKNAKVTMIEFSDFQCPFCERFYKESYKQIKTKYVDTGKLKIVYRHFPLSFHQNAQKAAEAAECANRQGKFEQYHNLLFDNSQSDGTGLNTTDLKKYADQLGLNKGTLGLGQNKFNTCLDNGEAAQVVSQDVAAGTAAGVDGTPSFFINGKKIVGAQPYSVFEAAIEAALK